MSVHSLFHDIHALVAVVLLVMHLPDSLLHFFFTDCVSMCVLCINSLQHHLK